MEPTLITEDLVRELGPTFTAVAQRAVQSRADAEDLVQEMWIGALGSAQRFEGRSSVRSWLSAILRRRIAERFRRARPIAAFVEELYMSDAIDPAMQLETQELAAHALRLLPELTELERNALALCTIDDLERDEACERLGITRGHMRVLLHRARRKLERQVDCV